ncbi:MAG: AI-2E family transporter [bacterium]|nr:AI-2E family transporter [bacterium]
MSVLSIGFLWLLAPFFSVLLFSTVLALTGWPFYQVLLKLFKERRHVAAFFCLLLLLVGMALPLGMVITFVANQFLKLAQTFHWDPDFFTNFIGTGMVAQAMATFREVLGVETDLGIWLNDFLRQGASTLYQFSPNVVSRTAHFFVQGIITLLVTYFLFVDGPKLFHFLLDLSPLKEKDEQILVQEIRTTLKACIYGYLLTAFVQGLLALTGFWIAGIKIALLLGVATFIMAFVPFFGTASVWVPVVLYLFSIQEHGKAVFLLIYGTLVISGIDNILRPLLIRGKTNIHPLLLFLAIFGGLKLWGPIGLLTGPVLVAVFLAILRIYQRDFSSHSA